MLLPASARVLLLAEAAKAAAGEALGGASCIGEARKAAGYSLLLDRVGSSPHLGGGVVVPQIPIKQVQIRVRAKPLLLVVSTEKSKLTTSNHT
jgi:hypothetical protein